MSVKWITIEGYIFSRATIRIVIIWKFEDAEKLMELFNVPVENKYNCSLNRR